MRLDLKEIIHVPGAKESFSCELDLSSLDFYGAHPICEPVTVVGEVRNRAGMLELEATLSSNLHLHCDSCGKPYERVMSVPVRRLLATELENEEEEAAPTSEKRRMMRSSCCPGRNWMLMK